MSSKNNGVTAVLLNWRRPWNIPAIVDSLEPHEFIRQIIIWDNAGILHLDDVLPPGALPHADVMVHRSVENRGTYGRFLAASRFAKYPTIYTQDDDIIVNNIGDIHDRYFQFPGSITAALSPGHHKAEAMKVPWIQLGWGSMFARDSVSCLDKWEHAYPEEHSLLCSKADRIYTTLHNNHSPMLGDYKPLKNPDGTHSERDASSLWLQRDHVSLRNQAVAKAMAILQEERDD